MKVRKGRLNNTEFINNDVIRKVAITQEVVRPYRLKVEAWALSQAKSRGVNTPRVLDYYRDSEGREVLVLERIHGKHLLRRLSEKTSNACSKWVVKLLC